MNETPEDELKREAMTKCVGYLEQIYDGQLSRDDAYEAILDRVAHLDGRIRDELSMMCFAWEQQRKANR